MLLHRQLPLAAAVFALACAPSVPSTPPPASVSYAVFDVSSAVPQIPLPNDLAITPSAIATFPPSAQRDLLAAFHAQNGFPNDQELDITIDFQTQMIDPKTGAITNTPAQLDLSTVNSDTVKILELPGASVPFAPITAANYVSSSDRGTLTLKSAFDYSTSPPTALVGGPWKAGTEYAVAIRGGPNGVKTIDGVGINPSPTFYLLTRGVNLSLAANETLLPGTPAEKLAAGAQLEALRQNYVLPFVEVSAYFPTTDIAVMSTFLIAPNTSAYVQADPNRGLIPLPSDFLLDSTGTHVQNVPAFGPLAAGIATLDGFSTTGLILSTTSAPILAATVTNQTVFIYDLTNPASPVRVPDGTEAGGVYQSEPLAITETVAAGGTQLAVSTAIGLQPAIPLASGAMLPPLKENTEYAVLISDGVLDLNQRGLSRSTLAQLLLFEADHPVAVSGKSQVSGVSDAEATLIESIRQRLNPAIAKLQSDKSIPRTSLAMAYTFRTQSITGVANLVDQLHGVAASAQHTPGLLQFAALPYSLVALPEMLVGPTFKTYTADQAWQKYGIDTAAVAGSNQVVRNDQIANIIEATITIPEILSDSTGAFDPALAAAPHFKNITALIATPLPANVPDCPIAVGLKCAPLVVFHHGLGGTRAAMLTVANELTAQGFVVAAIDMAKHGDRSWCSADNQCDVNHVDGTPGVCVEIPGSAAQGDAVPPGICSTRPIKEPTLCDSLACVGAWEAWTQANPTDPADGNTPISANYFVSANFFRTRDTMREDVIDQAALILALARLPPPLLPAAPTANEAFAASLEANGIVIDPSQIYWEGQSLGAILGSLNGAADSRISRLALNVGGGTVTDIITNAPAFASSIGGLLSSVGITAGTPAYLQFLILAKWILDPADPINVAGNILGDAAHPMLPDLLSTAAAVAAGSPSIVYQSPKLVIGQMAACDNTVPNPFNLLLYGNIGLSINDLASPVATGSTVTLFNDYAAASGSCLASADAISPYTVPHAFLTNWGVSSNLTASPPTFSQDSNIGVLTKAAQDQAALFLADPQSLPPSVYPVPQ